MMQLVTEATATTRLALLLRFFLSAVLSGLLFQRSSHVKTMPKGQNPSLFQILFITRQKPQ